VWIWWDVCWGNGFVGSWCGSGGMSVGAMDLYVAGVDLVGCLLGQWICR